MQASNHTHTKINNKNFILKEIIINKCITRIDLAKFTGLTKMTVTNIVNELKSDGLILESDEFDNQNVGRNPIMLCINPAKTVIGVYLNRDYAEIFAGDMSGNIYDDTRTYLRDETTDSINKKISSCIDKLLKKYKNVLGIGISAIGPLDSENGIILDPPNFVGIKNYCIKEFLQNEYDLPVYVENDMNTSAIAEKYWGFAGDIPDYIYLGATNGIGAGIVMGGHLSRTIGEIGHVSIDINGAKCRCGNNGCLEMYASIPHNIDPESHEEKCRYLAHGVITLINLFDPGTIFLGHRIPLLGEDAPDKIKRYIKNRYISKSSNDVEIKFSKFGRRSPKYGAVAIFVERHIF